MGTGTASMGKRSGKKNHIVCRRCGKHAYHATTGICASCGFGKTTKLRSYSWQKESKK